MTTEKTFKLDIFKILGQINSRDLHVYEKLSDEEKKGFTPYIISQWLYGTNNLRQVMFLNELVNPFIWSLGKHPELLVKLMACCGTGSYNKFSWIPFSKKEKQKTQSILIIMQYYDFTEREAKSNLHLLTKDDIIEMAEELGLQNDEISKLKKEW
jgi:hypothetical protein